MSSWFTDLGTNAMDRPAPRDFYVYALFRHDGRVFYIGKGRGPRWDHHVIEARSGKRGYRFNIIRDMLARGVDMPMVKVHTQLTEAIANAYEIALIAAIGRGANGPLVNLTDGGEGVSGRKRSLESIERSAVAQRGRPRSPEELVRLAAGHRGKSPSTETRAKLSAALLGVPKTAAHIANRSAAQRGRKWKPEHLAKRSETRRANTARRRAAAKGT